MDFKNIKFWTKSNEEIFDIYKTNKDGLDDTQAKEKFSEYGPNSLLEEKKDSIIKIFFSQFKDLLVLILCIAAIISMVSGKGESTIVIFAVLLLNAVLGTIQYVKAETKP